MYLTDNVPLLIQYFVFTSVINKKKNLQDTCIFTILFMIRRSLLADHKVFHWSIDRRQTSKACLSKVSLHFISLLL